jgi:hypothetical protein
MNTTETDTPTRRFDTPWKEAIEAEFDDFLQFFAPEIQAERDLSLPPTFLNPNLLGSPENPVDREVDLLVQLELADQSTTLLLLHIEIQSQYDKHFEARLADYSTRLITHFGWSLTALVILADGSSSWRPQLFEYRRFRLRMTVEFDPIKLLDFESEILHESENPFALVVLAHREAQRIGPNNPERTYETRRQLVRLARNQNWTQSQRTHVWRFIQWALMLPRPLELRLETELRREEETAMPYLTPIEERATARGREDATRSLVLRQIDTRFPVQKVETKTRLDSLEIEAIEVLALRILSAQTYEDLWDDETAPEDSP